MYMSSTPVNLGAPNLELRFGYDWMGRRVSKVVSNRVNGVWQLQRRWKYVYDGWNMIAEVEEVTGEVRTHVWGLDLSGTTHGAGGVGGLVATVIHTGPDAGVYFPVYDGNGNVMGYVRASDGAMVAKYEYGPFGELIRATGPLAQAFNLLFSTKYFDWETGLSYYGHRYYSPTPGRWLSRDPIGELGHQNLAGSRKSRLRLREEQNLYGFVYNDAVNKVDPKGLAVWWDCVACAAALVGKFGGTFAGCAYGCWESSSPSYPYGQCLSDCLTSTMNPCELWKSFKGNSAEWVGAAACISCGVRAIKEIPRTKPLGCDDCLGFETCHCFCPSGATPSYTVVSGAPCRAIVNVLYDWQSGPDGTPVYVPVGTETCACTKF
jgi:RHS repeat-associated protein